VLLTVSYSWFYARLAACVDDYEPGEFYSDSRGP
jgi:hypothetical protein